MSWPLRHEFAPEEFATPEGSHGAYSADSILERIAQRLNERSHEDAVRLFLDAQERGVFSSNGELVEELLATLGRDLTARLIWAFAHFPCPACKDGLEPCSDCEARGVRYEGAGCETCVGTGRTRCSFCGGTGLMTYAMIPASLRYAVLARRIDMLTRRIKPLINQDLPAGEPPLQDILLSLNKILLVFEDAVIASESILEHEPELEPFMNERLLMCHRAPQQLQPRMRSILRRLAVAANRENNSRLVDFYTALADSTEFAGTGLHHPVLGQ